jgi:hypothetical protein
MLIIQTQVYVPDITGAEMMMFMLHCTDREYQAWWQGTHLEFHTIKLERREREKNRKEARTEDAAENCWHEEDCLPIRLAGT